jgi:predicted TIM-barrel fold metal-dependent hydrolase
MSNAQRIDVHHHFLPPQYLASLMKTDPHWSGGPPIPDWNINVARETMARYGIAQAVGSVVPQTYWGDDAAAIHWSRHSNEFSARIVQDDPQRFGAFATLPLPNTEAACREIEYSLDELKLDGIVMFSSYDARYPGVPAASDDLLGSGKWAAGPTLVALRQTPSGWTYGGLFNHLQSFGGDSDVLRPRSCSRSAAL